MRPAYDVGILTGSGPDAGIDMWAAILAEWRTALGDRYRGDADAPAVLVHSVPELGASMDLDRHADAVRRIVLDHAAQFDRSCRTWVIACNTLNVFQPDIEAANAATTFASFADALDDLVHEHPPGTTVLLGARPVAELGRWSPYARLEQHLVALDEPVVAAVHALIGDVKRLGARPELSERLDELCRPFHGRRILLACTELPLIARPSAGYVDVTRAVARRVAVRVARNVLGGEPDRDS